MSNATETVRVTVDWGMASMTCAEFYAAVCALPEVAAVAPLWNAADQKETEKIKEESDSMPAVVLHVVTSDSYFPVTPLSRNCTQSVASCIPPSAATPADRQLIVFVVVQPRRQTSGHVKQSKTFIKKRVVSCLSGHVMQELHSDPPTYMGGIRCDWCRSTISPAAGFHHCPLCRSDACNACTEKGAVTPGAPGAPKVEIV